MLRPKDVVCMWVDAFNQHDADAIAALYHDEAVNHQVANEPVEGAAAIREMFAAEFAAANMVAMVENIFEDGQWAILEWRDPLGLRGCGFFQVVNGKNPVSAGILGQVVVFEAAQPAPCVRPAFRGKINFAEDFRISLDKFGRNLYNDDVKAI